jgi:hypothetical protein
MRTNGNLPRKEYKTISVKVKTFLRFVKGTKDARKKNSTMTNTLFLDHLLDLGHA